MEMTAEAARTWLVVGSLCALGSAAVFFFLAPELGFPLMREDAVRMLQIITPVFVAYLASASRYVFAPNVKIRRLTKARQRLLGWLVRGTVVFYAIAMVALLVAFERSHRPSGTGGEGMTPDELASGVVFITSILAATTHVLAAYLFEGGEG